VLDFLYDAHAIRSTSILELQRKVENESGCKSQTLVSDNRKENTSEALDRLCDDTDIHCQLSVPYNPQQNIKY